MKSIEWNGSEVIILDQTKLPTSVEYVHCTDWRQVAEAIKMLRVRGAPAIGVAAAYGLILAFRESYHRGGASAEILSEFRAFAETLRQTRPTAVNLMWAIDRVLRIVDTFTGDIGQLDAVLVKEAIAIDTEDVALNESMAKHGATLFQDKEFKKEIEKELKEKREKLLEYLKGKGIENKEGNKVYLVDIGWRGTIQDNLAFVLDKVHIEGGYIALFDYYNPQRENVAKRAFIRDSKVTWEYVALTLTIYEMMFSSDTKSVAGYENGKAIRKGKKEEVDFVKNIILPIREGMIDGAKYIAKFMKERDIMEDMYLGYLYNLAREIKENPSKILVEAYYSLVYNETFGTGEYLNGRQKVTGLNRFNIIYVRNLMRNEPWKESLIVGNDLGFYVWLLNHKHIVPDTLRKGKNGIKKVLSLGKRGVKKACRGAKKVVKFTIRKIKGQK